MSQDNDKTPPKRGSQHEALAVFLGDWRAEGTSYGGTNQSGADPRANGEPWKSKHTGRWHTGEFFLIQDERANIADSPFDTLFVMGVDDNKGGYFAQTFENHGYRRHYALSVGGSKWTLTGDTERATISFSDDNRKQTIIWEWKVGEKWLPLCDRVAIRRD
jgi:hypothetical protein